MEQMQEDGTSTVKGFVHDRLTLADDSAVDSVREHLHACPHGEGPWLSLRTGEFYLGRGGNDRQQWELQREAPWVRVSAERVEEAFQRDLIRGRDEARAALSRLHAGLAAILEEEIRS